MLRKIPNILTIGRILIVPFFVLAFYLPGFYGDLTALILFIVASFTDFLDGMLARLLGEESKLGQKLYYQYTEHCGLSRMNITLIYLHHFQ